MHDSDSQAAGPAAPGFAEAVRDIWQAHLERRPAFAADLGLHEHDGRLGDVSAEALDDEIRRLEQARQRLEGFDGRAMPRQAWLEHEVLLRAVRSELFILTRLRAPWRDPLWYLEPASLAGYIARDYAPLAERAAAVVALCRQARRYFEQARRNLDPRLPRPWIEAALAQAGGMLEFARTDVRTAFAGAGSALGAELDAALDDYDAAVGGYRAFLDERLALAVDDFALGPELFRAMLAETQGIDLDLDTLRRIGEADTARNLAALEAAAASLAGAPVAGIAVAEVVARVKRDRPAQLLDAARALAAELRRHVIDERIVTIPSEHVAEVEESPAFMRWNTAFLSHAGPFETTPLPSFFYITPPDPTWPEAEQDDYTPSRHELLSAAIHELWPGHFLATLHLNRNPSAVLKTFCTYSTAEGWAHYAEEMMLHEGMRGHDPAARIGQLVYALLRDVRLLSAVGLHTGAMTLADSQRLFETTAFQDAASARQQAVRGTFDPMYLAYTLGKLAIVQLRDDWKAQVGPGYSLQAFHDRFLSHGGAPLPVIREAMLGPDAGPLVRS